MLPVFRILSVCIIIFSLTLAGLGLINLRQGLPANSLQGVRNVAEVATDSLRGLLGRRDVDSGQNRTDGTHASQNQNALQNLLGCDGSLPGTFAKATAERVYRWRDADGVVNYADRPAVASDATSSDLASFGENFGIDVRAENAVLPAQWEGVIRAGAKRGFEQWREWLGEEALVKAQINIRFLGDAKQFATHYGKPDQDGWTTTGFYRMRDNEALILFTPDYRLSALATAFHEMSHLITAWHLGPTPPWLNEGIAEHFETMQPTWNSAEFSFNRPHLDRLRKNGPLSLIELTSLSRREWGAKNPLLRYASAWSIVAFLMDSDRGQQTLRRVVRDAHSQRCSKHRSLQEALASYPGGTAALEEEWHRWIRKI